LLNRKMVLAPILAVALVLSLAVAVSYLPSLPQATPQNQPSAVPTPNVYYNVTPSNPSPSGGSYNVATPAPTSAASTAAPLSGIASFDLLPALSVAAALILGIVAALLFFSEKSLKKELGKDH
jgi:hypothetical protein